MLVRIFNHCKLVKLNAHCWSHVCSFHKLNFLYGKEQNVIVYICKMMLQLYFYSLSLHFSHLIQISTEPIQCMNKQAMPVYQQIFVTIWMSKNNDKTMQCSLLSNTCQNQNQKSKVIIKLFPISTVFLEIPSCRSIHAKCKSCLFLYRRCGWYVLMHGSLSQHQSEKCSW